MRSGRGHTDTRLFRYESDGEILPLTSRKLNEHTATHMAAEFAVKDCRTRGGALLAAVALAEHGLPERESVSRRVVAAVMRGVGERHGNTAAVARASYVSPAVVGQYLDGRTIADFRPLHSRVVRTGHIGLDVEEEAVLSLRRSWRIRASRKAA